MGLAGAVVVALLAADLIAGLAFIGIVAIEYRRQLRLAQAAGEPLPRPAIWQFVFLVAGLLSAFLPVYAFFVLFTLSE